MSEPLTDEYLESLESGACLHCSDCGHVPDLLCEVRRQRDGLTILRKLLDARDEEVSAFRAVHTPGESFVILKRHREGRA